MSSLSCGNKEEALKKKAETEFLNLTTQAEEYYKEGRLSTSLEIYHKAFALKEDQDTRRLLKNIQKEKSNVEPTKEFTKI